MPAGKLSPQAAAFPVRITGAVAFAYGALSEIKPAAVVGFGGFVSFPTVVAAKLRGIPVYLHEQNTLVGKVNRFMSKFADGVFASFESTVNELGPNAIYTGNPSRYEGMSPPAKAEARKQLGLAKDKWTLFAFGGSQGARSINQALLNFIRGNRERKDIQILHLTGRANYESVKSEYEGALGAAPGLTVVVKDYLKEMELAYGACDIALCRAGATTITEITSLGVPAVLVPYPFAAENHQEINASYMVEAGAAVMVLDRDLSGERIAEIVQALASAPERCETMARRSRAMYKDGVAKRMADVLDRHLS